MSREKRQEAEDQPFQDLIIYGVGKESVSIGVLPHVEVLLGHEDVKVLTSLIKTASQKNGEREQYDRERGLSVSHLKDDNVIRLCRGQVEFRNLLNSQWKQIYQALKSWLEWKPQTQMEEYRVQIAADQQAYRMFQEMGTDERQSLSEAAWESIFDKSGVELD